MNSFGGLITQIVTDTNDADYVVGQVFSGYFQYDSIDGNETVHLANTISPGGNRTLRGLIYVPLANAQGRLNALPCTMNDGSLTVAQGVVTAFDWTFQVGGNYARFTASTFVTLLTGRIDPTTGQHLPDLKTEGKIVFSKSIRQS